MKNQAMKALLLEFNLHLCPESKEKKEVCPNLKFIYDYK